MWPQVKTPHPFDSRRVRRQVHFLSRPPSLSPSAGGRGRMRRELKERIQHASGTRQLNRATPASGAPGGSMTARAKAAAGDAAHKESLKTRAIEEARRVAIITLYLWFLFALFGVYKRILLQEHGISAWNQGFAIVNALVFAKVILLGQALNVGGRLRGQALAWIVLGKSALFAILLIAFHLAEEAVRAWFNGLPLSTALNDYGGGTVRGLAVYAAIFFVALSPFFTFQEVGRVLGAGVLWDFFFASGKKTFRLVAE